MKAVKVERKNANLMLKKLKEKGLYNDDYEILKKDDYLYIPIKEAAKGFDTVSLRMKKRKKEAGSLADALVSKLKGKKLGMIPRSFDVIGDIAIMEIPEELISEEKLIGETLLKLNNSLKVITKKIGIHSGKFRTQKLRVIAGAKRKTTLYRENNVRLKLNVETCYFSPRLSTERGRVAKLVKKGERVLVMFSGVAPYPLVFSKNTEAREIYGVEFNPEAHKFGLENVKLNKVKNVQLFEGDVRKVVSRLGKFDRILMPLPKDAADFLDTAVKAAKKDAIIHLYDFVEEKDFPKASIAKIKEKYPKARILRSVKCGQCSPRKFRVCIDFRIS